MNAMPPSISVRALAGALGLPFTGDGDFLIRGVAPLEAAGPGDLSFADTYDDKAAVSKAGCLFVPPGADSGVRPAIRAASPRAAFFRAVAVLRPPKRPPPGMHPAAFVASGAQVDASASVGPLAVVSAGASIGPGTVVSGLCFVGEGVRVGRDCVLHPGVVLYEGVSLGNRVILHGGVVVGADGFGYVQEEGRHVKIPQIGTVRIEDDVEIGANTCVDRATLAETVIGAGTKIDNLVQVGHNVRVGRHAILVAQVGIGGSTVVGDGVFILGQAAVRDHVTIGPGAMVGPQAGVMGDVPAGGKYVGTPAKEHRAVKREIVALARLPGVLRSLPGGRRGRGAAGRGED